MANFYKGTCSNAFGDQVIAKYIKGIKIENGIKKNISTKINKYNIKLIGEINDLNNCFYKIIMAEKVAIKLLEINSNNNRGEISNLWNLIKSQSGTIRYNKALKFALKNYAVDNQDLYNRLRKDIAKQRDRLTRNEELTIKLLRDYGLGKILDLIQNKHDMSIVDHIAKYTYNIGLDISYGSNKDDSEMDKVKEYYTNLVDKYIEYLQKICLETNNSLNNEISDELLHTRALKETRNRINREEALKRKEKAKRNRIYNILSEDASIISQDINSDYTQNHYKIEYNTAAKLRRVIETLGGTAYFISMALESSIRYFGKNDIHKSIKNADWFNSEEADKKLTELENDPDYAKYTIFKHKVILDTINSVNENNLLNDLINKEIETIIYSHSLHDCDPSKFLTLRKAMYFKNGSDSSLSDGEGFIYLVISNNFGKDINNCRIQFVGLDTRSKQKRIMDNPRIVHITKDIETDALSTELDLGNNYLLPYKIHLSNKLLDTIVEKLILEIRLIQSIYNSNFRDEYRLYYTFCKNNYLKQIISLEGVNKEIIESFRNRLYIIKQSGYSRVYYILSSNRSESKFYNEKSKYNFTKSLSTLNIFTDYNKVMEVYHMLFNMSNSDILKIGVIEL